MFLRQLILIGLFSFSWLQPNGCSSKQTTNAQTNQNTQTQATPTPKGKIDRQKGEQDKMDLLTQKVLNKDLSAEDLAKQMGKSAIPVLKPLVTNSDEIVRMIAVRCLEYTPGEGVEDILINALKDKSSNVSIEASRILQRYLSPEIYPKLLEVYDEVEYETRRKEIALMLGKIDGAKLADLKQKDEGEKNPEAKEGLMVAMAKLGDHQSREAFLARLQRAKGQELKRFLDYVEYIQTTWAVRGLSPILGDKSELVRIGIDGEEGPEYLRACDVAVNLIYKLMKPKFSFLIAGNKNYSEPELQEVRAFFTTLR